MFLRLKSICLTTTRQGDEYGRLSALDLVGPDFQESSTTSACLQHTDSLGQPGYLLQCLNENDAHENHDLSELDSQYTLYIPIFSSDTGDLFATSTCNLKAAFDSHYFCISFIVHPKGLPIRLLSYELFKNRCLVQNDMQDKNKETVSSSVTFV